MTHESNPVDTVTLQHLRFLQQQIAVRIQQIEQTSVASDREQRTDARPDDDDVLDGVFEAICKAMDALRATVVVATALHGDVNGMYAMVEDNFCACITNKP